MKTTGIGSLPFTNPKDAELYSLRCDLPFIPELPKAGEHFFKNSADEVITKIKMYENITNKMQFKVQLLGPTTFHNLLNKNSSDTSYEKILAELLNYLAKITQQTSQKVYLQLDEPIPPLNLHQQQTLDSSLSAITKFGFIPVVHSCQKITVDFFPKTSTRYLAIDLNLNPQFTHDPRLLIAGVDPRKTYENNFENINAEFASFTCGMGLMSEDECEEIFRKLKEIK